MKLYLVRHPRTVAPPELCYGSTDVAVSQTERAQALQQLRGVLPRGLPLYSSTRRRCAELARDLAASLGCAAPVEDARLVEMDFGHWEMQAWDAVPRVEIDAWAQDAAGYHAGGGESLAEMAARVGQFYRERLCDGRDGVVVCHGGAIKMMLAWKETLRGEASSAPGAPALLAQVALQSLHYASIAYGSCVLLEDQARPGAPTEAGSVAL